MPTVLASLLCLTAVVALAAPAGAHSNEGEMTVTRAEESGPLTISVDVGVLYADGHLAEDAEVYVDASTKGTNLDPVRMERKGEGSSVYSAEIRVPSPGEWSLTIESTNPIASATHTVDVTDSPPPIPTSTIAPTTTAAAEKESTTTSSAVTGNEGEESASTTQDEGSSTGLLIGVVVAAVVVIGGVVFVLRQRARRSDT